MDTNEQENDSVTSSEKVSVSNENTDESCDKVISKCDDQTTGKAESTSESSENKTDDTPKELEFKKPLLIGKRGKIGKLRTLNNNVAPPTETLSANKEATETNLENDATDNNADESTSEKSPTEENLLLDAKKIPVPYSEPNWGGKPTEEYSFEILKSGVILEKIDLTEKSFHVVGRSPLCNLSLGHPTISRHHAVIQYRAVEDEKHSKGFYLYDLGSTHGTFWNGHRIKARTYVPLHGGHMIKFGCSQRKYILQAPSHDVEEESELSVTQLKEKRMRELQEQEIKRLEQEEAEERARQAAENEGIDWGMGEDADEETDLTENPYAVADEELYLDDPKKTLRGWFEREGYDLQYQVEERGIGQFLCWINLPKECFGGRFVKAEALVKGKKKESVVQCALEACRILDRHGLLRQANHESRRKKERNWEEEDYYDSDEDNFLDRTGTIERKREQRMKLAGKLEDKVETYSSLIEKHNNIVNKISQLNKRLKEAQGINTKTKESSEDSLDAFMSSLNTCTLSKSDITKMKVELQNLRKEEMNLIKLINLTKPADLPPLVSKVQAESKNDLQQEAKPTRKISQLEKRRKLFEAKNISERIQSNSNNEKEEEEEDDNEEEETDKKEEITVNQKQTDVDVHKSEDEDSTSHNETTELKDSTKTNDRLESVTQDTNTSKQENEIANDKKRRKDRKFEKSKSAKKQYDQDVYSADYSTWVPPQDQSGDGRTSLNEKYGY